MQRGYVGLAAALAGVFTLSPPHESQQPAERLSTDLPAQPIAEVEAGK